MADYRPPETLTDGPFTPAFNFAFNTEIGSNGPEIRCAPADDYSPGVQWVYGGGLPGTSVLYIDRVHESDNTRHRVAGSVGMLLSNDRTYTKALNLAASEQGDLDPQEYSAWLDEYPAYCSIVSGFAGAFALLDSEIPLDQMFHYEVHVSDCVSETEVYSSFPCYYPSYDEYIPAKPCVPVLISDPLIVGLGQWTGLMKIDPLSYPGRQDLVDVYAREFPVGISDVRSAARTTIYLMTKTLNERKQILSIIKTGRILLLRNPDPNYPENNWYISVGDVTEERVMTNHGDPVRRWVLPIAVVERPFGYLDTANGRNYQTVRDYNPDGTEVPPGSHLTYKDVATQYYDYLGLILGEYNGFVPPVVYPFESSDQFYGWSVP